MQSLIKKNSYIFGRLGPGYQFPVVHSETESLLGCFRAYILEPEKAFMAFALFFYSMGYGLGTGSSMYMGYNTYIHVFIYSFLSLRD